MSQSFQVHLLRLFSRQDMTNLSVSTSQEEFFFQIFQVFITLFAFPTLKIYCKSIYHPLNPFASSMYPDSTRLNNTAFAIVFLPEMPHGPFFLDDFILMFQILLTIAFVFTSLTFRPLLSSAYVNYKTFFCRSSIVSDIKTNSSTYYISCSVPSFIFL